MRGIKCPPPPPLLLLLLLTFHWLPLYSLNSYLNSTAWVTFVFRYLSYSSTHRLKVIDAQWHEVSSSRLIGTSTEHTGATSRREKRQEEGGGEWVSCACSLPREQVNDERVNQLMRKPFDWEKMMKHREHEEKRKKTKQKKKKEKKKEYHKQHLVTEIHSHTFTLYSCMHRCLRRFILLRGNIYLLSKCNIYPPLLLFYSLFLLFLCLCLSRTMSDVCCSFI